MPNMEYDTENNWIFAKLSTKHVLNCDSWLYQLCFKATLSSVLNGKRLTITFNEKRYVIQLWQLLLILKLELCDNIS